MKSVLKAIFLLIICIVPGGCNSYTESDDAHLVAIGVILIITALFLGLAIYSNLLRDEISDLSAFDAKAQQMQKSQRWISVDKNAPFSLTKVQFGLWTVIISSAYIYLSLFKGDCAAGAINKTALVLMGIFAGTAVASSMIDKNEINDNRDRHQNSPSQGFFIDILSDDNGISLHRFQNFAWTIIAITVYLYKLSLITKGCELPELSDTLLALTGISSVTYLTLKTQENDPPIQAVQQANKTAAVNNSGGTTAPPVAEVAVQ
ncbi:hypothetical protein [Dyadobacter sp. NIV53]|uniref:hypothetical protein n=1 Tax=Dyadobacter sp. NIV53 TaxID=2861765 RepID=UPI001C870B61|nr:hypothetical protein [Dyadobacter sp. NIV53]